MAGCSSGCVVGCFSGCIADFVDGCTCGRFTRKLSWKLHTGVLQRKTPAQLLILLKLRMGESKVPCRGFELQSFQPRSDLDCSTKETERLQSGAPGSGSALRSWCRWSKMARRWRSAGLSSKCGWEEWESGLLRIWNGHESKSCVLRWQNFPSQIGSCEGMHPNKSRTWRSEGPTLPRLKCPAWAKILSSGR